MSTIIRYAIMVMAVILSLSVHELAHGLVSQWLGDDTPKRSGRLTLNPFAHVDWAGLLCLLLFGFGWAKPVPVDPREYKDPKMGMVWTAFAGPVANFLFAFLCMLLYCIGLRFNWNTYVQTFLSTTAILSTGFGIFNCLPIPPLDGSKILFAFLLDDQYFKVIRGNPWMNILFIILLWSGIISGPILNLRSKIIQIFLQIGLKIVGL